jgi:hypothetical protein
MKLATTVIATALLISSKAFAVKVERNRKVKIYSSTLVLKSVKDDIVDPFLALPDEREQRGLQELSMSMSSSIGSVPMSMSSSIGSVPTTIGSMPLTTLEMSMPATIGCVATQSFSYPPVCQSDEYRRFPDGDCGDYDIGECKPIPSGQDCVGFPNNKVCGCDGVQYKNSCKANQSGTSIRNFDSC